MDIMPAIPRAFFLYVEPLLITFGATRAFLTPRKVTGLLGLNRDLTPLELMLAGQNSVNMLLIALANQAIMVYGRSNHELIHAYVAATALVDVPYLLNIVYAVGMDKVFESATWNPDLRMEMLGLTVTFTIKVAYLLGLFGKDKQGPKKD